MSKKESKVSLPMSKDVEALSSSANVNIERSSMQANESEKVCCHYATMFWEDIDGIVENIVSYDDSKREGKQSDIEAAFGSTTPYIEDI